MAQAQRVSEAVLALLAADQRYLGEQASAANQLSDAQRRRETAMRHVAALGLSHRRIADLTSLSHTRVNQILGAGTRLVPEAHLPPGFGGTPKTVASAAVRLMAEHGPQHWTAEELRNQLDAREWPSDNIDEVLIALVSDGVVLSADNGAVTIHSHSA